MTDLTLKLRSGDVDQLRLLGISRIPRCSGCPRLLALVSAAEDGPQPLEILPPAPQQCRHQVCKPLIPRAQRGRPLTDSRLSASGQPAGTITRRAPAGPGAPARPGGRAC